MEIEADKVKEGLKTAVAQMFDPSAPVPGSESAEQLGFLPELPLDSGFSAMGSAAPRRGPGRPPGAKNKNTEAWREYLLSKYRNPLEVLAQTYSSSPAQLAAALGKTTPLTFEQACELFKLQIMAAKELAPYVNQKMPLAIDNGDGAGLIQLVINQGAATAAGVQRAGFEAFKVLNTPDEENQLVTEADFEETAQPRHNRENAETERNSK